MSWKDLSIRDKAAIIRQSVSDGLYNLSEIRNKFEDGGNLFSGKDKNQPTQKMHLWGEFGYPKTVKPSTNKYERISGNRYNTAFNALTNAGYEGVDADRLAQILSSQSISETGWIDKNDTHNYAGYLNSKGKLISYDSPEHFWKDHIANLSNKWPEWDTANNTDEYFDIVNHTDLGLTTLDKFNAYNRKHKDNPVYIYAPDWQNENYDGRMRSVNKRASKYYPKKVGPIY